MDITTKPYYKYKKGAYKNLAENILGMLKRVESLKQVVDLQFATYDELELFIGFSESKLASIDIYYLGRVSVGYILLPIFDYDPVRFYVDSDCSNNNYGIVLKEKEAKVIREESLALFKSSQNSSEVFSDGHVTATSSSMAVVYIESDSDMHSVVYRGQISHVLKEHTLLSLSPRYPSVSLIFLSFTLTKVNYFSIIKLLKVEKGEL